MGKGENDPSCVAAALSSMTDSMQIPGEEGEPGNGFASRGELQPQSGSKRISVEQEPVDGEIEASVAQVNEVHDAARWHRIGVDAETTAKCKKLGIDYHTAARWQSSKGGVEYLVEYMELGGKSSVEASNWKLAGFYPDQAVECSKHNLTMPGLEAWVNAGATMDDIVTSLRNGISLKDIEDWGAAGVRPATAISCRLAGMTYEDIGKWAAVGVDADKAVKLVELKLSPDDVETLRGHDCEVEDILKCSAEGISPQELARWAWAGEGKNGFDGLIRAKRARVDLNEAWEWWEKLGYSPASAVEARDLELSLDEAKQIAAAGYMPSTALLAKGEGISLGDAQEWSEHGFQRAEATTYLRAGIEPGEAFDWEMAGFTTRDIIDAKKNGIALPEAKRMRKK